METEAEKQARLKKQRYDNSLIGGVANKAAPYIASLVNKFSDYRQSNLNRTDDTLKSYGYDLGGSGSSTETSGSTESSGRISPNQNAGKTFQQLQDETNNISDTKKASMDKMKEDFMGVKPVESVGETSEQNPLKITGETNISNGGKQFVFGKGRSSGMNLSIDNSISNLGKNLQQNMDLDSKFDKTNNNVSSKTRGGLFGNYGKKVEIRKTFDESTGRTNKQKFIDGELASDRNSRQDVRRKGRSTDARSKRKAGRNK